MTNNKITEKVFYKVEMKAISPLAIGNGLSENSDNDVILDCNKTPYIPATSIAGVFSHYLVNDERKLFSPSEKMSPIFISDAKIIGNYNIVIRDGIKLEEDIKTTIDQGKFDYEIIETGAVFQFHMELTHRNNETFENMIETCLKAISTKDIAFGSNTTKGLGYFVIEKVCKEKFDKTNAAKLINFDYENMQRYEGYKEVKIEPKYIEIKVKLKQLGGISIRSYIAEIGDVDYEHIKCAGNPIIPGSSWNGAIRKRMKELYEELIPIKNELIWDNIYGFVQKENKSAHISNVTTMESVITGSKSQNVSRTKIDRFSGGTVEHALYDENATFNGNTDLVLRIKKGKESLDWVIGLFLYVVEDIKNGLLAIGGLTSIGRGMFEVKQIEIDGRLLSDKSLYEHALLKKIKGENINEL